MCEKTKAVTCQRYVTKLHLYYVTFNEERLSVTWLGMQFSKLVVLGDNLRPVGFCSIIRQSGTQIKGLSLFLNIQVFDCSLNDLQ